MTDWKFRRSARTILHKVRTGEMHMNDALVRLQMLHEGADTGQRYDHETGRSRSGPGSGT